jgi:transcriptional regulator with XRE-family HTH domain
VLRLKFERISRGLSQQGVTDLTQIPQPAVSLIETGRVVPTPEELQRLADVFGVPPAILLKHVAPKVAR